MDRSNESELLLVRHPEVDARWRGVCYGRTDVELSSAGRRQSKRLAGQLARLPVQRIVHSGLQRTSFLAEHLAQWTGLTAEREDALAERDFGCWEMQTWDAIYQRHGDEMLKMVSDPNVYRPGGGETTQQLADRVWNWYQSLPVALTVPAASTKLERASLTRGLTVAITHGGPIAACLGRRRDLPVDRWASLIPACGELRWVDLSNQPTQIPANLNLSQLARNPVP